VERVTRLAVRAPALAARFFASWRLMARLPVKTTSSPNSGWAGSASGFGSGFSPSCGHRAQSCRAGTWCPALRQPRAAAVALESGSPGV
jgi:hypothetical protein